MVKRTTPKVFVSVGTDHHPFQRLVGWVDSWAEARGVPCLVQHGSSPPPTASSVQGVAFLSPQELSRAMRDATAVVTHGGPGTIAAARGAGRLPVVVARNPSLSEHVDDHQLRFVQRMGEAGLILEARTESEFSDLLDRAIADPDSVSIEPRTEPATIAAERFGQLVEEMVERRTRRSANAAAGAAAGTPVTVLYIGGAGRSGSTLLDRLLGRLPGFVSAGEVVHLWRRGLLEDQLCGCGERFGACPFWRKVGDLGFGGWDHIDADTVLASQHRADRNRFIPAMRRPRFFRSRAQSLDRYGVFVSALYRAIADAADAKVVVDSSKHASTAFLLARTPGIDLRVVHLVRDPRGVAHSWSRRVRRPEVQDRTEYMPTPGPGRSSAEWLAFNWLFERLRGDGVPSVRVRYEDLAADPGAELDRVLTLVPDEARADGPPADLALPAAHTVSGNPMRFETGEVKVKLDDEWRARMSDRDRRLVEAVTWPLLGRYGYRRGTT